jgi:signal transduction histidine kinase
VPIQKTLMLVSDLVTAALLFGQYSIGRNPALNILAAGYLFTAIIVIPHALTFPGVFSETGLIAAGPQSAAWLYVAWHTVLPLAVIAFALRRPHEMAIDDPGGKSGLAIFTAILSAAGAVMALTLIVTAGHRWLPLMMDGGHFTTVTRIVVGVLLLLPLSALLVLATKRQRSVLDLWLMVVMFAWLCTITIGAFLSGGRFDVGWYLGSVFDWLTSIFVLLMLLSETVGLYARQFRAVAIERRDRERRFAETEVMLIHLSRVTELGQNVSSLIHEISQPLTAIANYAAAGIQLLQASKPDQAKRSLELLAEQTRRTSEIVDSFKEFIRRHEPEKRVENLPKLLRDALRLSLVGGSDEEPAVQISCSPSASSVSGVRVQIEQVVFNLIRNAVEAMRDSRHRMLTLATI